MKHKRRYARAAHQPYQRSKKKRRDVADDVSDVDLGNASSASESEDESQAWGNNKKNFYGADFVDEDRGLSYRDEDRVKANAQEAAALANHKSYLNDVHSTKIHTDYEFKKIPEIGGENVKDITKSKGNKCRFELELPEEIINNYSKIYEKEKKKRWPAIGSLYTTDFSRNEFIHPLPLKRKSSLQDFDIKENLIASCQSLLNDAGGLNSLQLEILSVISTYRDFLFNNRTYHNGKDLRIIYCLHALNHVLKAKAKIIHHNSKLSKNSQEEYQDQGFTRPLVLMLVPFREDCYQIVNIISQLLTNNVLNKKRFEEAFFEEPRKRNKPEDFEKTFEGNIDECFKIGLKIKNRSITLFADFYSSELIIASPLGLRQIIGGKGDKDRDFDFLSSIEVLLVDRADVLMMQNWYHVNHIMKHLNLIPKDPHGCDMFRVRPYARDGLSRFYRQTILMSSVEHEWFQAMFSSDQCQNYAGCVRTCSTVASPSISQVVVPVQHTFLRFETESPLKEMDDRFNFFISKILPQFRKDPKQITPLLNRILIYVPFYHDFLRLRNYFRAHEVSSTMLCEDSTPGKVSESRNWFFQGRRQFMLYTERFHFYNRYQIKGVQHVIFYRLPTYPHFYQEICNLLRHADLTIEMSCSVIVNKFDFYQLKQTVGSDRAMQMLNSNKKVITI